MSFKILWTAIMSVGLQQLSSVVANEDAISLTEILGAIVDPNGDENEGSSEGAIEKAVESLKELIGDVADNAESVNETNLTMVNDVGSINESSNVSSTSESPNFTSTSESPTAGDVKTGRKRGSVKRLLKRVFGKKSNKTKIVKNTSKFITAAGAKIMEYGKSVDNIEAVGYSLLVLMKALGIILTGISGAGLQAIKVG